MKPSRQGPARPYAAGIALLRKTLVRDRAVRLIGLTAINLTDVQQLTLFDAPDKTDRITASIDAVREKFGERFPAGCAVPGVVQRRERGRSGSRHRALGGRAGGGRGAGLDARRPHGDRA